MNKHIATTRTYSAECDTVGGIITVGRRKRKPKQREIIIQSIARKMGPRMWWNDE